MLNIYSGPIRFCLIFKYLFYIRLINVLYVLLLFVQFGSESSYMTDLSIRRIYRSSFWGRAQKEISEQTLPSYVFIFPELLVLLLRVDQLTLPKLVYKFLDLSRSNAVKAEAVKADVVKADVVMKLMLSKLISPKLVYKFPDLSRSIYVVKADVLKADHDAKNRTSRSLALSLPGQAQRTLKSFRT
jgi:hypothetical protein